MRDLETISTAITAAETGHLVFATLHTQDAPQTIDRIIDVFPPHQQQQVRVQLAATLQGVVHPAAAPDGGRAGAGRSRAEVLVATPAIRNLIREGKVHQIYSVMQAGGRYGMQTMDMSLAAAREGRAGSPSRWRSSAATTRGAPAPRRARRGESARGGLDAWRRDDMARDGRHVMGGCEELTMPETFTYKVRDRRGNVVAGTLVADSEALVLQRLREMGYMPARGRASRSAGSTSRSTSRGQGQAEGPGGLLPPVRHDDQLGPVDPARAARSWPSRPRTRSSPKILSEVPHRRRAGRVALAGAWPSTRRSSTSSTSSMVKSGETGGVLDTCCCAWPTRSRSEVELRGKIKSAMTYPVAVVVSGAADHERDAAVRRPAVRDASTPSSAARCRCRRGSCSSMSKMRQEVLVGDHRAARSPRGSSSAGGQDHGQGPRGGRRLQAAGPGLRLALPQDGAGALLPHPGDAAALRRADPPGAGHRGRHREQQGHRQGRHGRAGERARG